LADRSLTILIAKKFISKTTYGVIPACRVASGDSSALRRTRRGELRRESFFKKDAGQAGMTKVKGLCIFIYSLINKSNFVRVITNFISILSLRVCLRRSLRCAERFFENEEIAELFPDEVRNLRVCFGFTSNCSATCNDRFFIERYCVSIFRH